MLFLDQILGSFGWCTWFSCNLSYICCESNLNASPVAANRFIHFPVHNVKLTAKKWTNGKITTFCSISTTLTFDIKFLFACDFC